MAPYRRQEDVWAWGGGGRKPPWIARPASQQDSVRAPVRSSAGQLGRRRSTASGGAGRRRAER
ncbi:hypothetical protein GQ55_6G196100 [Panicum hallii var. hallii]|uniref:Uncharacterized protein n=1 Tax=Panicum hallii var. hallii TaxID=1504633 RepID=A0A2T7D7J0_9POAL|nr:hypothetical protein GQ55_6G196100 [Panicum hallii var. hallii]